MAPESERAKADSSAPCTPEMTRLSTGQVENRGATEGRSIRTTFENPPIHDRSMDWSAIDDNTYCGCGECRCLIGRGATEQEAIADLLEQEEEKDAG